MRTLSTCPLLDAGQQCQSVGREALQRVCPSKWLVFSCVFLIYYAFLLIVDSILFSPLSICIISSLILLCCCMSDHIGLITHWLQFTFSQILRLIQIKLLTKLSSEQIALFKICKTLHFYRNKHVYSAHWVNSTAASGFRKLMCHDN